jgi:hypothetical protein
VAEEAKFRMAFERAEGLLVTRQPQVHLAFRLAKAFGDGGMEGWRDGGMEGRREAEQATNKT